MQKNVEKFLAYRQNFPLIAIGKYYQWYYNNPKGGIVVQIKYLEQDKLLFFSLEEEIDHHTTKDLRRKMDYEIERHMPKKVIFNFDSVNFMDSAGIGLLLGRYKLLNMLRWRSSIN